jgi:hypothetical protein
VVDMFLTFSGSSASNLLTCHQFKLRTGQ